jgi:hypothetical protein
MSIFITVNVLGPHAKCVRVLGRVIRVQPTKLGTAIDGDCASGMKNPSAQHA